MGCYLCYIVDFSFDYRGTFMTDTKSKKRKPFGFNAGAGFFKQMSEDKKEIMKEKRKRASAKRRANRGKTWHTTRTKDD